MKDIRMDHKQYLQWIYTNCWLNHFQNHYESKNQFCVASLDQIEDQTSYGRHIPFWKAVSFAESGKESDGMSTKPKYAELAIIYSLPEMLLQYFTIRNEFPKNIYIFTLHIPCDSVATRIATMITLMWNVVKSRLAAQDEMSPPGEANDWIDYFEHNFSAPTYHIGWDKTFEETEEISDETIVTDIFEKEDIKHYCKVEIDENLHVMSETLNNHFKEYGSLLNYD